MSVETDCVSEGVADGVTGDEGEIKCQGEV